MLGHMAHSALTPVFVGLRTGLHVLFVALCALVIVRAVVAPTDTSAAAIALTLVLVATYALGAIFSGGSGLHQHRAAMLWLGILTLEWAVLLWLVPEAAYLVFPLFFLYLHLLGSRLGILAVVVSLALSIIALGVQGGWSVGGVVGPLVGAGVAVMIGLGYQALARESVERERLMAELIATRDQLAATEHESGVLAERGRLAREIHDTVAQGLSSIQMLLHAAEGASPDRPGIEHIRLARETAAASLAETRRFIRELTPPDLDDQGLGGALRRLADAQWAASGVDVTVRVADGLALPMHLQTALLRIAQGAMANVIQHANASSATISLERDRDSLRFSITDDGDGFDPHTLGTGSGRPDSFGLQATRERVDQLGGTLTVDSAPGRGTTVTVDLGMNSDIPPSRTDGEPSIDEETL